MFNWLVTESIFLLIKIFWRCFIIKQELPINGQIRAKEVQLIGAQGEKLGVVSFSEAMEKAEEANLDLVLVAPNATPVVCKIMNYGKYKFEQAKKEKEAKKKQKVLEVKEIRVTPNIEKHDFEFKCRNAKKFIEDGNKVKITVRFRGREVNNSKAGEAVLNNFIEQLGEVAQVEKAPKLEGRNMFTILAKKSDK
ncbi:MAG: translation initiation factor IF-3 [Clostridia bacterium]|nr:translation initiation factor IF-3 [Clostridia bacterium]